MARVTKVKKAAVKKILKKVKKPAKAAAISKQNGGNFLTSDELQWFKDYHAFTNYIGAAALYLNFGTLGDCTWFEFHLFPCQFLGSQAQAKSDVYHWPWAWCSGYSCECLCGWFDE